MRNQLKQQITVQHFSQLFPHNSPSPAFTVTNCDIPLLYSLIRNVSSVPPPITGWGKPVMDQPRDTSVGANVERLRDRRNHIIHLLEPKVSNHDFHKLWEEVTHCIVDIEIVLGGYEHQQKLKHLKTADMDPNFVNREISNVKSIVQEIQEKQNQKQDYVLEIRQDQVAHGSILNDIARTQNEHDDILDVLKAGQGDNITALCNIQTSLNNNQVTSEEIKKLFTFQSQSIEQGIESLRIKLDQVLEFQGKEQLKDQKIETHGNHKEKELSAPNKVLYELPNTNGNQTHCLEESTINQACKGQTMIIPDSTLGQESSEDTSVTDNTQLHETVENSSLPNWTVDKIVMVWPSIETLLLEDLCPKLVISFFEKGNVFSKDECDMICRKAGRRTMTKELLSIMKDRLPQSFAALFHALNETDQQDISKELKCIIKRGPVKEAPVPNSHCFTVKAKVMQHGQTLQTVEYQVNTHINQKLQISLPLTFELVGSEMGSVIIHLRASGRNSYDALVAFCKHGGMKNFILSLLKEKEVFNSLPAGEISIEIQVRQDEEDLNYEAKQFEAMEKVRMTENECSLSCPAIDAADESHAIKENLLLQYEYVADEIDPLHFADIFVNRGILQESFFKDLKNYRRGKRAVLFLNKVLEKGKEALYALTEDLKNRGYEDLVAKLCFAHRRSKEQWNKGYLDGDLVKVELEVPDKYFGEDLMWSCHLKCEKNIYGFPNTLTIDNMTDMKRMETHEEETMQFNFEALFEIIVDRVDYQHLMTSLPMDMLSSVQEKEIHKIKQKDGPAAATKRILEIVKASKKPGKYQALVDALKRDYLILSKALTGHPLQDDSIKKNIIKVFSSHITERMSTIQLLPYLIRSSVIVQLEKEMVEAELRNYGNIRGAQLLLLHLPAHVENWYTEFLKALCDSNQRDLAEFIDESFTRSFTNTLTIDNMTDMKRMETHEEETMQFNFEALFEIIVDRVDYQHLMTSLPTDMLSSVQEKEIHKIKQKDGPAAATKRILEIVKASKKPGKYQALVDALKRDHLILSKALTGHLLQDDSIKKNIIKVFSSHITERMSTIQLLPYLIRSSVIVQLEKEMVEAELRNYGNIRGAQLLLLHLPAHVENWYTEFLKALCDSNQRDLAEFIDESFTRSFPNIITIDNMTDMKRMETHEEETMQFNFEALFEIIVDRVDYQHLMAFLPIDMLSPVQRKEVYYIKQRDGPSAATRRILEILKTQKMSGKYRALVDALQRNYPSLVRALTSYKRQDFNMESCENLTKLFSSFIAERISIQQLLPYLLKSNVIVQLEKEMVESELRNYGNIRAAQLLFLYLPVHDKNWYIKVLKALCDSEQTELAKFIDQSFVQNAAKWVLTSEFKVGNEDLLETKSILESKHEEYTDLAIKMDSIVSRFREKHYQTKFLDLDDESSDSAYMSDSDDAEEEEYISLRMYQEELARPALQGRNVIILAPTGSGKPFVACRIIQGHFRRMKHQRANGMAVLLVKEVTLAHQLGQLCKDQLPAYRTQIIAGETKWNPTVSIGEHLKRCEILVLTAHHFLYNLMNGKIKSIADISLLIFDECHHCEGNHPYNKIMQYYMDLKLTSETCVSRLPQIIGLASSLDIGKAVDVPQAKENIIKLMANLDAELITTVTENVDELRQYIHMPPISETETDLIISVRPRANDVFSVSITKIMNTIENMMRNAEVVKKVTIPNDYIHALNAPSEKGSEPYMQWLSDMWMITTKVPYPEVRRFIRPCFKHLQWYNEALIIYNDARVKDAVDFLEEKMDDWQSRPKMDGTEQCLLMLYRAGTQSKYIQEVPNPKLNKLKDLILRSVRDISVEEFRCIVFVKTRALARALVSWMTDTPELNVLSPTIFLGVSAGKFQRGIFRFQQVDKLAEFRRGRYKIIVATSVAEEGLDIQQCNLVFRYDHVTHEIAMVQSRERAFSSRYHVLPAEKGEINTIQETLMQKAVAELQLEIQQNIQKFKSDLRVLQDKHKFHRDLQAKQIRDAEIARM